MFPTIALAVTTYNSSLYLLRTLASSVNQSVPFDEIVVIDDCSSDNPELIVNQFNKSTGSNVRFYALEKNFGGPAKSRNHSAAVLQSDLIAFLDADDILTPDRCLNLKLNFSSQDFDVNICRMQTFKINEHDCSLSLQHKFPIYRGHTYLDLHSLLDFTLLTPGSSLCFRASALREFLFSEDSDIIAGEDREILIRMSLGKCKITYSNSVDVLYNNGLLGANILSSNSHITSPARSLRIAEYYHEHYDNVLHPSLFVHVDLSYLIALFRLKKYFQILAYIKSLPIYASLGIFRIMSHKILSAALPSLF